MRRGKGGRGCCGRWGKQEGSGSFIKFKLAKNPILKKNMSYLGGGGGGGGLDGAGGGAGGGRPGEG